MIAVTTALALADATGLTSWIGKKLGGDSGEKTAQAISGIAQGVTGASTPEEALKMVKSDPDMAATLREKLMDQEHELTKAYLADVKDARAMYEVTDHTMADKIADKVMTYNVWFVFGLIGVLCGLPYLPVEAGVMTMLAGVIGGCISSLWNERVTAIAFFLGSSKSSADKSEQMTKHLSKISKPE